MQVSNYDITFIRRAIATKLATRYGVVVLSILLNASPVVLRDYLNRPAKLALAVMALGLTASCLKLPDASYETKLLDSLTEIEMAQTRERLTGIATTAMITAEMAKDTSIVNAIAAPAAIANHYLQKYQVPLLLPELVTVAGDDNHHRQLTVNPSIASNKLDLPDPGENEPAWLSIALDSSVFISGKKGSGKTYLMKWLAQQFAIAHPDAVFYIIDPHYDADEPWLGALDQTLAENNRLGNGKLLSTAISDVLRLLEYRKSNAITHRKKECFPVRIFLDELEALPPDYITEPVALIENEGRKYNITVCLGAHSTKKENIGLDSSVLDSMLLVLFKNTALDVNAKFSGVFPSKPVLKRMFDTYPLAKDRLVAVYDGDVYVSHVPPIDLDAFDQKPDFFDDVYHFCTTLKDFSRETIIAKWQELTGQTLTESGFQMLMEKLMTKKNSVAGGNTINRND